MAMIYGFTVTDTYRGPIEFQRAVNESIGLRLRGVVFVFANYVHIFI